jgi:hypothetical protein
MRVHLHWLTRWRMHRIFTQELKTSCYRALLADLSGCDACARRYNRYHLLEAALCGTGKDAPSVFAIERLWNAVLDSATVTSRPHRKPALGRLVGWIAGAMFAATTAILLVAVRPWSGEQDHVAMRPNDSLADVKVVTRGGASKTSEIGIRLFKVESPTTPHTAVRHHVGEPDSLGINDVITFTYTNVRPDIRYAAIFGVQADGDIRWYHPGYRGKASILLHGDKVDEPLGDGIRLGVHHTAGWLRITAIFSTDAIPVESVRRAVRLKVAEGSDALRNLDPLAIPGTETLQHALLTHIVPVP